MRLIIPEDIKNMIERVTPYMQYVDDVGMVLKDDAPQEIIDMKRKISEWFDENRRY